MLDRQTRALSVVDADACDWNDIRDLCRAAKCEYVQSSIDQIRQMRILDQGGTKDHTAHAIAPELLGVTGLAGDIALAIAQQYLIAVPERSLFYMPGESRRRKGWQPKVQ